MSSINFYINHSISKIHRRNNSSGILDSYLNSDSLSLKAIKKANEIHSRSEASSFFKKTKPKGSRNKRGSEYKLKRFKKLCEESRRKVGEGSEEMDMSLLEDFQSLNQSYGANILQQFKKYDPRLSKKTFKKTFSPKTSKWRTIRSKFAMNKSTVGNTSLTNDSVTGSCSIVENRKLLNLTKDVDSDVKSKEGSKGNHGYETMVSFVAHEFKKKPKKRGSVSFNKPKYNQSMKTLNRFFETKQKFPKKLKKKQKEGRENKFISMQIPNNFSKSRNRSLKSIPSVTKGRGLDKKRAKKLKSCNKSMLLPKKIYKRKKAVSIPNQWINEEVVPGLNIKKNQVLKFCKSLIWIIKELEKTVPTATAFGDMMVDIIGIDRELIALFLTTQGKYNHSFNEHVIEVALTQSKIILDYGVILESKANLLTRFSVAKLRKKGGREKTQYKEISEILRFFNKLKVIYHKIERKMKVRKKSVYRDLRKTFFKKLDLLEDLKFKNSLLRAKDLGQVRKMMKEYTKDLKPGVFKTAMQRRGDGYYVSTKLNHFEKTHGKLYHFDENVKNGVEMVSLDLFK